MIVTYLRSSSLNTYSMCQQQYFINYVLGVKNKDNGKAIMGSVMHKNLELLAKRKLADQNGDVFVEDDNFGKMRPSKFKNLDKINKMSYEFYEQSFPGIMPAKAEVITLEWTKLALSRYDGEMNPEKQNIFSVEDFFEIEIDKPWAKYEYELDGKTISGQLGIKGTVDLIVLDEDGYYHVIDYKGLPLDTLIPTPDGWSTMGNLEVGDIVFDQHGEQTKIIGKSDQKIMNCYRIYFDDGSTVECDDEHYWKLDDGSKTSIKDIRVGDLIRVAEPINCKHIKLPDDPYSFGSSISSNNIFEIPQIYLRSSYEDRKDLLAGIMDSCGSVDIDHKECIINCHNQSTLNDVNELLVSLGQKPIQRSLTIYFRPIGMNPFLLSEKRQIVDKYFGSGKFNKRVIVKIEKIDAKITQCICVDSEDSTFLCTKNMIPTHNSGRRYNWSTEKIKTYESLQNDKQLLLYYYALRNKYPDKKFRVSIYYVNDHIIDKEVVDGGVFTFVFDDEDYQIAENIIKKEFESIRSNNKPSRISKDLQNWKCKYLCGYSKIIPDISTTKPACLHIAEEIEKNGIDYVTSKYGDISKMTQYTGGGRINVELKND